MYGKMKDHLSKTLAEIKEAGLYKEERLIESAQQAAISVKGKEVLNFCANNYLGLSNHPRLIAAPSRLWNAADTACRPYASSAEHRTSTRSWKQPSPTTSRLKTPFSTPLVSTPMAVCSSPSSPRKTPSSRTP